MRLPRLYAALALMSLAPVRVRQAPPRSAARPGTADDSRPPPRLIEPLPEVESSCSRAGAPARRRRLRSARAGRIGTTAQPARPKTAENPKPVEPVPEPLCAAASAGPEGGAAHARNRRTRTRPRGRVRDTLDAAAKALRRRWTTGSARQGRPGAIQHGQALHGAGGRSAARRATEIAAKYLADKADTIATALTGR